MKLLKLLSICLIFFTCWNLSAQNDYYIYVSDAGGFNVDGPWQIIRYDLDGSNPLVLVDDTFFESENIGWPQDILFLEDQNVMLVSCLVGNRITKHNAQTGAYIEDFASVPGGPTRMKLGDDGFIYVVQWSNTDNKILRFQEDGTLEGAYTNIGVGTGIGIDWDSTGNLYITSYGGNAVKQFDDTGVSQGDFIDSNLNGPTNVHVEDNGNFLVLNWGGGDVVRFDSSGNFLEIFTNAVSQPEGIAPHPSGGYLIGNGGNASIDLFMEDGTFVDNVVESGSSGLVQPNAVVLRDATLGVGAVKKDKKIIVIPSVGTFFQLHTQHSLSIESLELFNLQGQKVASLPLEKNTWDASNLQEGVYFLKGTSSEDTYLQKIVVKK
tara:strand:- start:3134 stop:4270 length:1137 start_codon:yes stop_codon:yes gene_type:complete